MIELIEVQDDLTYTISLPEAAKPNIITVPTSEGGIGFNATTSNMAKIEPVKYATITLTGADLKKLILILNLSIGNMPENAPDVTDFVRDLTKRIGF